MTDPFGQVSCAEVVRLVAANPLAWLMADGDPAAATPMPLLLETDADGAPRSLLGHLPRAHPLVPAFTADPNGSFLFNGPAGYITPGWIANKDWAPTWNFAVVAVRGTVAFDDALTGEALERLVAHMETGRIEPWTVAAMGDRYEKLAARVVGFRVTIESCRARFKLGQDEDPANFATIIDGLGDAQLARLMTATRKSYRAS
ncbi:FMN-binding negative transcriptional regulator [Sphingomonas sp. So64.6b]|uniref:FMN-binding negative transcriptional regulator n=1 Tax=Sphingomonas sp. So64.6b TaxID=2997354 RepID=UPI0016041297|nr:FMN-binding negative transcriptional regulator [Sphingomonas sp. So64.6b]QNA86289.1 FMN-binding negative transcriptional regulator [Sphingomonas sp. So64.6b]